MLKGVVLIIALLCLELLEEKALLCKEIKLSEKEFENYEKKQTF